MARRSLHQMTGLLLLIGVARSMSVVSARSAHAMLVKPEGEAESVDEVSLFAEVHPKATRKAKARRPELPLQKQRSRSKDAHGNVRAGAAPAAAAGSRSSDITSGPNVVYTDEGLSGGFDPLDFTTASPLKKALQNPELTIATNNATNMPDLTIATNRAAQNTTNATNMTELSNVTLANITEEAANVTNITKLDNATNVTNRTRLNLTVEDEIQWYEVIASVSRHTRRAGGLGKLSPYRFYASGGHFEWLIFLLAMLLMGLLSRQLTRWSASRRLHGLAVLVWAFVGAIYCLTVLRKRGRQQGEEWLTGWIMEFIFSIENVFVYQIVVKAFKAPRRQILKAMFITVCSTIAFQGVFYMGLAAKLRSLEFLPYILGLWLVYVGFQAGASDDGHGSNGEKRDATTWQVWHTIFFNRFTGKYDDKVRLFVVQSDGVYCTMLVPLVLCLQLVVFSLEVDVTLTKIEELDNLHLSFTSSAVAAWAIPDLFFVARNLVVKYPLLKYGIAFVLIFFGVQMILNDYIFIPELISCSIIIGVMILCVILSPCLGLKVHELSEDEGEDERGALGDGY